MSAFVIDSATMHKVINALCTQLRYQREDRTIAGLPVNEARNWTLIGRKLFAMNIEAVTQRYPDCKGNPGNMPGGDIDAAEQYNFPGIPAMPEIKDKAECLKALACLLYQSSEGNVSETALYKEIDAYEKTLGMAIINEMPEYQAAKWG
jgi:hypothetical protein